MGIIISYFSYAFKFVGLSVKFLLSVFLFLSCNLLYTILNRMQLQLDA